MKRWLSILGKCQIVYKIREHTGRKLGSLVVKAAGEVPEDLGPSPRDLNQLCYVNS